MINYKLINKTDVYETQTEQIIKSFKDQIKAKTLLKHLNFGGGFDGYTPEFFNIKFQHIIHK
jgi:hypothetical protein